MVGAIGMSARATEAARLIATSRVGGNLLQRPGDEVRPLTLDEAYLVQDIAHKAYESSWIGPRIGWKIGCTTPVMQAYLGIDHPCAGGFFASGKHDNGAVLDHARFHRIGVECEIAMRIDHDITGAEPTRDAIAESIGAVYPAIEIVDDRYEGWRTFGAPLLVADDFFAAGCVLGHPVDPDIDLTRVAGTTTINGEEAGSGLGSDVMGDPLNAVQWLADNLAGRGLGLRAGDIVLSGSLVETRWLSQGDSVRIDISGLGSVGLSVDRVAATRPK